MRAANCLREHYAAPALLIGHSLGGMRVRKLVSYFVAK
jgi:triacylglycerol esterase/lipase EstA (alpha/beta hydrolase family)